MIGNDLVDLKFAKQNSRWKEQRFLDKLFTSKEQDFILSDGNRFQNIWRLWSMKESAYKIISRANGIVRFNPKDFECSITNIGEGWVSYESIRLETITDVNPKFIQSIAFLNHNWTSEVISLTQSNGKFNHQEIYQHVIKAFANLKYLSQNSIEIRKNKIGMPEFYKDGILQKEHVSLSHHGHFGAWAIAV